MENPGLAWPIADCARNCQGSLAKIGSLVPVTLDMQKITDGNRNPGGMYRMSVVYAVPGAGVQVGALGLEPGYGLFLRAHFRSVDRPGGWWRRADNGVAPGSVLTSR